MKKQEAIRRALEKVFLWTPIHFTNNPGGRPGELIEQLDEETRETLKTCTGKDWMHRQ